VARYSFYDTICLHINNLYNKQLNAAAKTRKKQLNDALKRRENATKVIPEDKPSNKEGDIEARKILFLHPDAIAYEEEHLVGSGKSIVDYSGRNVEKFAKMLSKTSVIALCGAGISKVEDYVKAREMGCEGIVLSSAIAKNNNPEKLLNEFKGVKNG
jgi:indole-3-glycerol phosphate synthase